MSVIKVISLFEPRTDPNGIYINTTSKVDADQQRDLSPFYLGPCDLYDGHTALRMENAWQFSKVYLQHTDDENNPTDGYWEWAKKGWADNKAHRYPMGKGILPEYSYWEDQKYPYIEARKKIYVPLYARAVKKTKIFQFLKDLHQDLCAFNQVAAPEKHGTIYLLDYDAYRHEEMGMTLTQVLNNKTKKSGHAFVLMMLLTNDDALKQCSI